MENQSLLPQSSIKDEKKNGVVRRVMPFALVLAIISVGFLVTYNTTAKSNSSIVTADTTLLKSDEVAETKFTKHSDTVPDQWWTFNPTPINDHPTHKPTEEKRMLKQETHKPTHNKHKPTHEPTQGNPSFTSQPTPHGFEDDETYNPTPINDHPTKKPTNDAVLKKDIFISAKRVLHKEDSPRGTY